MKLNARTEALLIGEGYFNLVEIPGRGIVGLRRFMYTVGLCYDLDEECYRGRYCFEHLRDAVEALIQWDGQGDPAGPWLKHKGWVEYPNPHYEKER
jgi:hypothetical protein